MVKKAQPSDKQSDIDFKELTEYILKSYLDATSEEDMEILTLLDENMSVIGTGKQEFFKNLQEFSQAFVFDVKQRENIHFQWEDFSIEEQILDENHVLVYGSVLILGLFESGYTCINMDTRFSILYGMTDGKWKVLHIHHSVPDKEQMENEEFPCTLGQRISEIHTILATAKIGTWVIYLPDDKAPSMKADDLMKELLGITGKNLTPEEVYDAWFSNIIPEAVQSVLDSVEKMKIGVRDENTYLWKHPVLGERYVRCGGTAEQAEDGFVLRGYHYDVDDIVREEKKKDEALAEQIAIIDTLSKSFQNVFIANLNDGRARVVRLADEYHVKAVRDIEGKVFSIEDVIERWIKENVCQEDKIRIEQTLNVANIKKVLSEQDEFMGTYRSVDGDELHNYQFDFRRIGDTGNIVAGFQIIDSIIEEHLAQEKRERKLNEEHLREVTEHAEVISSLSTIYSTIFRAEIDTHHYEVLTSIPLMEKVAGSSGNFDEVKEDILSSFMTAETREPMRKFLDLDTLAERLEYVETISTEYKNRSDLWMEARFIVKRRDENGHVHEVLYVARDITTEKMRELEQKNQLAHALAAAQQASEAKSTFLNNMSHDIRTPMNAIIGFTALAQTHIENQAQVQDYLAKISTSSTHLLSLINDILDMSRIESGVVKLDEKPTHLPELLHDLRTMIQGLINSKNLNLYIDTQDIVHEDVITDKLRLNQILINIVGNAVKFTQPGGDIIIWLREKPCAMKRYTTYEFSVKDTGIGMSQEFLEHIFDAFSREYSSTVSGIQGTGLGMAITKNIVDMMGGNITVESEEGKGSLFTVTLDLRHSEEYVKNEPIPELPGAKASGVTKHHYDYSDKHILLVDDNELNREIAIAILEETGMTIDSVNDGDIAVAAINGAPPDKYDLILMDIQMPKMDGYTATKEIRTLPDNKKANIPIVAMTANAFEEDKQKAYESGMNGHIIKPISIEAIANVLDTIFDGRDETQ